MYAPPYQTPPFHAPPQAQFPPYLGQAPKERRLDETFGWFPGAAAVGALFFVVGKVMDLLFGDRGVALEDTGFIAGGLLVCGLFAFWEIFRRTRPTSLVVLGDRLGIYRKGQLSEIAGFGQITHFRLSVVNTLRECMFFGIVGLGGAGVMLASETVAQAFFGFGAFVLGGAGFASCLWSRAFCVHYWIPKGGGTETVVLRRKQLERMGWRI